MGNAISWINRNRNLQQIQRLLGKCESSGETMVTLWLNHLPENTSDEELQQVFAKLTPVETAYVNVCYVNRLISKSGLVVLKLKHARKVQHQAVMIRGKAVAIVGLHFSTKWVYAFIKKKQEYLPPVVQWITDVRPGHPDYCLPEIKEEVFDLSLPDLGRPSAHKLNDDGLYLIFKKLTLQELLRIERTCRRWQWVVHRILGGHTFVNLADKSTVWGNYGTSPNEYYPSLILQKILLLNGSTMEHLILDLRSLDLHVFKRAVKQCAPRLVHAVRLHKLKLFGHVADFLSTERGEVGINDTLERHSEPETKDSRVIAVDCPCTRYMEERKIQLRSETTRPIIQPYPSSMLYDIIL